MIYKEEVRDLFSVPEDYYLAHCISADFGMGKGIAVEFVKRFDTRNQLLQHYPNYYDEWKTTVPFNAFAGGCLIEGRVLNLITKERYFHKPTYDSMTLALENMQKVCKEYNIKKVAMPLIGCGLDKLKWDKVKELIIKTFALEDIEILVCRQ